MIYVSLSVLDLKKTLDFYTEGLRLFKTISSSRASCVSGVDLILDLYEIGSERHLSVFETGSHVLSKFSIHHGESIKIKITDRLEEKDINYDLEENIAGQFLRMRDPSGNKFAIWSNHGGIS